MLTFPTVNGNTYDFSSIEARINGRPFRGFKSINYKDSLKPGTVRGTSALKLGRTRGEYDADADVEIFREDWADIRNALGPGYMEAVFDIVVQYQEAGKPMHQDTLRGCRITENSRQNAQGSDGLTVKLTLDVLLPIEDGGLSPLAGNSGVVLSGYVNLSV